MKKLLHVAFAALLISSCKKEINDSMSLQKQSDKSGPVLHPLGIILDDPSTVKKIGFYSIPQSLKKALPSKVDLSGSMPDVGDQGFQGSCVGWATGYYCKTYQEVYEKKWKEDENAYSPSWVYNQINGGVDEGSRFSEALDLLVSKGCDFMDNFRYASLDYISQPDNASKTNAAHYKSSSWKYLTQTKEDFRTILASSQVILISLPVYPDFDNISSTNEIYDDWSGVSRGNHALCVVGYDDSKQAIKFINSWGASWGLSGYGWIAYDKIPDLNNAYILSDKVNIYDTQYLLGDFDGDKNQDVFTANGYGFYISWNGQSGLKKLNTTYAPMSALALADFNADGISDVFYSDGINWFVSYSGTGWWSRINASPLGVGVSSLKFGDFNADGKSDVFYPDGSDWFVSYSGSGSLTKINSSSKKDYLQLGDFNGDGKYDVFYPDGTDWYVCYSGVGVWYKLKSSPIIFSLAVGDFNGDGKSDMFYANGTGWYVSYSGTGGLVKINNSTLTISDLKLANFNGNLFNSPYESSSTVLVQDKKCDVFHAASSKWEISWSGTSTLRAL